MSKPEELINLLVQNKLITAEQLIEIKKRPEYNLNPEEALVKSGSSVAAAGKQIN